ncbi:MAG: MutT/NUDIX family protein [Candidatus Parcubacteria bacterium]|jgi:8-oxo-dGTP diphosphatase
MEEDKSQQFVGKVCQKAIIVKDEKIFVSRGVGDKVWEFPGGRMHLGESAKDGLEREIREELGLKINRGVAVYADRYYHLREPDMPHFGIFYVCTLVDDSPIAADESEVQEYKWISRDELNDLPMYDDCHAAALAYLKV